MRNTQETRVQKIILCLQLAGNLIPSMEWSWATESSPPPTQDMQKTFESPLDSKEIKTVHPKGNQSWIFTGILEYTRVYWNILKLKLQYFGHLMQRANLLEKTLMLGRVTRGVTEDEMIGWHHRINGHEFEQTPGDNGGQGSLACCSLWGRKESDTT